MYEIVLNQSRTSLTTNSSRSSRIVRKRDYNHSTMQRSKSKNKEDQCNLSFEEYLNNQTKYLQIENAETSTFQNSKKRSGSRDSKLSQGSEKLQQQVVPVISSQPLMTFQLKKATIIEKSDRYIGHRMGLTRGVSSESREPKVEKYDRQKNTRKREPTPIKSKKEIASTHRNDGVKVISSSEIFQFELRVAGLQQNLFLERQQKSKIQNQLKQLTFDVQNLKEILNQVQIENKILVNEKKELEEKVEKLQKTVLQSETNLNVAQNNLNKLKQTIKENRLNELQLEIKKIQKANQALKDFNNKSVHTIDALNLKLATTTKQVEELRKFGGIQTLAANQSMKEQYLEKELDKMKKQFQMYRSKCQDVREHFLEEKIKEQQITISQLEQQVSHLLLKLNCLEYRKNKEMRELKESSDAEIKALRVKYSKMVVDLKMKKSNSISESPKPNSKPSPSKIKNNIDIICKCSAEYMGDGMSKTIDYSISKAAQGCQQQYRASSLSNKIYSWEKRGNYNDLILELSPQ